MINVCIFKEKEANVTFGIIDPLRDDATTVIHQLRHTQDHDDTQTEAVLKINTSVWLVALYTEDCICQVAQCRVIPPTLGPHNLTDNTLPSTDGVNNIQ